MTEQQASPEVTQWAADGCGCRASGFNLLGLRVLVSPSSSDDNDAAFFAASELANARHELARLRAVVAAVEELVATDVLRSDGASPHRVDRIRAALRGAP